MGHWKHEVERELVPPLKENDGGRLEEVAHLNPSNGAFQRGNQEPQYWTDDDSLVKVTVPSLLCYVLYPGYHGEEEPFWEDSGR